MANYFPATTLRLDPALKEKARPVLSKLGLTITDVCNDALAVYASVDEHGADILSNDETVRSVDDFICAVAQTRLDASDVASKYAIDEVLYAGRNARRARFIAVLSDEAKSLIKSGKAERIPIATMLHSNPLTSLIGLDCDVEIVDPDNDVAGTVVWSREK